MADRQPGTMRLLFDGPADEDVSVSVVDAYGDEVVSSTPATPVGYGRYKASVTPSTSRTAEGVWTATWTGETGTWTQDFTVGPRGFSTKQELLIQAASRVSMVYDGIVTATTEETVTDRMLVGAHGDYVGSYLLFGSDTDEAGISRRVIDYNGSTLTLSSPMADTYAMGTAYVMLPVPPQEIERSLSMAIDALGHSAWVRVMADTVEAELIEESSGHGRYATYDRIYIDAPAGWSHIHDIYQINSDGIDVRIQHEDWKPISDRRVELHIPYESTDRFTLYGTRPAYAPVFPDSSLDMNPGVLVPAVSHSLTFSRSRGPSTDPDETIRRTVLNFEEQQGQHRRLNRRPPHGSRRLMS